MSPLIRALLLLATINSSNSEDQIRREEESGVIGIQGVPFIPNYMNEHNLTQFLTSNAFGEGVSIGDKEGGKNYIDSGVLPQENLIAKFLEGKHEVEAVQQELSNLLFGQSVDVEEPNGTTTLEYEESGLLQDDYLDYYNYDFDDVAQSRSDDENLPIPSKLRRRRPYLKNRRRPVRYRLHQRFHRGKYSSDRNPEINKIPGRIQSLPVKRRKVNLGPNRPIDSVYSETLHAKPTVDRKFDCDFYTDSLCLNVKDYPHEEISSLLGANSRASGNMIADVSEQSADDLIDGVSSNQESTYTFSHYFGERRIDSTHKHRDFAQEGGFLCPSEIKYAKPKRGKTAQGNWKDIVNVNDYTQTLRMEKCLQPGGSCSYVSHHYKSQCSQVYNYHRLLSWDSERGLHMDIYKVPTCCSCHIMGYSYVYPPLRKHSAQASSSTQFNPKPPHEFSNTNSIESTIPSFNPQAELEQFMQSIGDLNMFGSNRRPVRQPSNGPKRRPSLSGFSPSLGPQVNDQRVPSPGIAMNQLRRRGEYEGYRKNNKLSNNEYPTRRGDGLFLRGDREEDKRDIEKQPDMTSDTDQQDTSDRSRYQTIPLDSKSQTSINYGYHPIIDFFNQ